jgi:hypothetical protein
MGGQRHSPKSIFNSDEILFITDFLGKAEQSSGWK